MDIDNTPPQSSENLGSGKGPPLPPRPKDKFNLADFKNVAPFTSTTNEGLMDVNDLKTALPFDSQASTTSASSTFANCLHKIELPKVPKAPSPPSVLNPTSWEQYLGEMNNYLFRWTGFTAQILLLFQRRQEEYRELGPAWVGQVGGECEAYLTALDEDERTRKYWEVASELHRECFRNLQQTRRTIMSMTTDRGQKA